MAQLLFSYHSMRADFQLYKYSENLIKEILLEYITEYVKIFTEKIGLQANKIIIKKSKTKR